MDTKRKNKRMIEEKRLSLQPANFTLISKKQQPGLKQQQRIRNRYGN